MSRQTITVVSYQSLLDVALQTLGSIEGAIAMCKLNGLSLTSDITPGEELLVPEGIINEDIVNYFKHGNRLIATGYNENELPPHLEGISYWAINNDFIVQ